MKKRVISLLLICILIMGGSFVIGSMRGGEFGGADDKIEDTIKEINGEYEPWFSSFWQPPSGEIESLLFALQAAIGAGFLGYYIGVKKNAKTNSSAIEK